MSWLKAYKRFDGKLQCQPDFRMRPFQYKVGEEYIGDNDVRRKDVKCFYVDGKTIKENVEYTLVNGGPVQDPNPSHASHRAEALKECYGKCRNCVWAYNGGCNMWAKERKGVVNGG